MEDGNEFDNPDLRDVTDRQLRRADRVVDMEPLPTLTLDAGWASPGRRRGSSTRCGGLGKQT